MDIELLSTFLLTFIFIKTLINTSAKLGLQDVPNSRSSHKRTIPRSAGIGFTMAVFLSTLIFNYDYFLEYMHVYMGILAVSLIGLYDDRFTISHRLKFILVILIATYVVLNGVLIDTLGCYFGFEIVPPIALAIPISIFAIVGFTNALNLMDGLDGLAGTLSLIMMVVFLMIGIVHNDALLITLSATFIVALVVFLVFNWYPASIFMGDSGSLTLGFVISILSIKALEYMTPIAILFIISLPLIDTFIVMFRRLQRGQSPFKADKNHLHHFLYKTKLNVKISVMMLVYIQLTLSIIGFQMRESNQIISLIVFGLLVFLFLSLFDQRFKHRQKKKKKKVKTK